VKAPDIVGGARRRIWGFALVLMIAGTAAAVLALTALVHTRQTKATISAETRDLVVEVDSSNDTQRPPPILENLHASRVVIDAPTPFNVCVAAARNDGGCRTVDDILITSVATDGKVVVVLVF
jgi:hypothetical protein